MRAIGKDKSEWETMRPFRKNGQQMSQHENN